MCGPGPAKKPFLCYRDEASVCSHDHAVHAGRIYLYMEKLQAWLSRSRTDLE
jgi:hypothetical protein